MWICYSIRPQSENERKRKVSKTLGSYQGTEKVMERECDDDTNSIWRAWNGFQGPENKIVRIEIQRKNQDLPDHSILKIGLNTLGFHIPVQLYILSACRNSSVMSCIHCRFRVIKHYISSGSNTDLGPDVPSRLLNLCYMWVLYFFDRICTFINSSQWKEFFYPPSPI